MTNLFFPEEEITDNDLFFICYMIERVARNLCQRNKYVVNAIDEREWYRLLSLANVLHSENPLKVESEWIEEYKLQQGHFVITDVDAELVQHIPTETQMGKVYARLILDTAQPDENLVRGLVRAYNNPICEIIDDYNTGAFFEPSYYIARAYNNGSF